MTSVSLEDMRIAVIGAGRLGCAFALALREGGATVVAAVTRTDTGAARAAALLDVPVHTDPAATLAEANTIIIACPDAEIGTVARHLARAIDGGAPAPSAVVHMSGCTGLHVLAPLANAGVAVGSIHPIQTITENADADVLQGVTAAVTGDDVCKVLSAAAGMRTIELADEMKPVHHAACTIAANFTVTLLGAARDVAGTDDADLLRAYAQLAASAATRVAEVGPEAALTGPVARGDRETIAAHQRAIAGSAPQHSKLYATLTASTEELAENREVVHAVN